MFSRASRIAARILAAGAAVVTAIAVGAAPAQADEGWTWSTATHPAGAASIGQLGWGTSGGGVYRHHGMYFIPGVGHIDQPLGNWRYEQQTGSGMLGKVLYTTYPNSPTSVDMGLVGTGTKAIEPRVRVSDEWQNALVMDVAHSGEIKTGRPLCYSGTSTASMAAGGYRCGTVMANCGPSDTQCYFDARVSGGDSGGPVWDYTPGGITLVGWINGTASAGEGVKWGRFTPVWALQNHVWTTEQTKAGWPAGNDGTGCFVTATGCVRS